MACAPRLARAPRDLAGGPDVAVAGTGTALPVGRPRAGPRRRLARRSGALVRPGGAGPAGERPRARGPGARAAQPRRSRCPFRARAGARRERPGGPAAPSRGDARAGDRRRRRSAGADRTLPPRLPPQPRARSRSGRGLRGPRPQLRRRARAGGPGGGARRARDRARTPSGGPQHRARPREEAWARCTSIRRLPRRPACAGAASRGSGRSPRSR